MENDLLDHFLQTFQKAISVEMEAMRAALGPFEIGLTNGELIQQEQVDSQPIFVYRFAVAFPNDKLVPQVECTLRCEERGIWLPCYKWRLAPYACAAVRKSLSMDSCLP